MSPLLRVLPGDTTEDVHEVSPETLLKTLTQGDVVRAGAPPPRILDGHVVNIEDEQIRIDPIDVPGTLLVDPEHVIACYIDHPFSPETDEEVPA